MKGPSVIELQQLKHVTDLSTSPFASVASFEQYKPMAEYLASASVVPASYRNNPANCLLAVDIAVRAKMPLLSVFQNLQIINDKPAWTGKYVIATLNNCGRFTELQFEFKGEPGSYEYACRAIATRVSTGERIEGIWVSFQMVVDAGWLYEGSPWRSMPDLMYRYRSASFFANVNAADILLGLPTDDEARDIARGTVHITNDGSAQAAALATGANTGESKLAMALRTVEAPPAPVAIVVPEMPKQEKATTGTTVPLKQRKKAAKDIPTGPCLFDGLDDLAVATASANSSASEAAVGDAPAEQTAPDGSQTTADATVAEPGGSVATNDTATADLVDKSSSNAYEYHAEHVDAEAAEIVPEADVADSSESALVDLGVIRELCMRADTSLAISEVAKQLSNVEPDVRSSAEEEIVQAAMAFLAEETTPTGMVALKDIYELLTAGPNKNVFRAAFNGRFRVLQGQQSN